MPMPRDVVYLNDEQFAKLVELLTPGYELAKAYLAAQTPAADTEELDPETGETEEQEAADDGASKSD